MEETKLVGKLFLSLIIQLLLLPFRVIGYSLCFMEGLFRVLKTTVNNFAHNVESEVLK